MFEVSPVNPFISDEFGLMDGVASLIGFRQGLINLLRAGGPSTFEASPVDPIDLNEFELKNGVSFLFQFI